MVRVFWADPRKPTPSQLEVLRELLEEDVELVKAERPFVSAEEIAAHFRKSGCEELVVDWNAPARVLAHLVEQGIHPLIAEMQEVPLEQADFVENGRGYRFDYFYRLEDVRLLLRRVRRGEALCGSIALPLLARIDIQGDQSLYIVFSKEDLDGLMLDAGCEVVDFMHIPIAHAGMLIDLIDRGLLEGGYCLLYPEKVEQVRAVGRAALTKREGSSE
ncbi:hypothetical protein [Rhodothermus marinus]|uniref:hypothetical protein n=1 Tax=Rhodothermus marinus TaxID=29549 RepID=UPI0013749A79|nr:hypothetical protein [Rhodothermus marinus]